MRRTGLVLLVVAGCLGNRPVQAQGYELGMLMLLAGPVSEAVQETVLLIRRGAVTNAAALVFLMPPLVALEAWVMFGETLTPQQIVGMLVTAAGVWLTKITW